MKKIYKYLKITLPVFFLAVLIAIFFNYAYQKKWVSPRYWDETVARSNKRVADTVNNFIYLYGSQKFAELDSTKIKNDFSDLGYNLNIIILRNDQIVARTRYYPTSKSIDEQQIHYSINCTAPNTNEKCSILILEATAADARNLDKNYIIWLYNWLHEPKTNFEPKFNNITVPFFVILSSTLLIALIILSWYFHASKKEKILRDKKEENDKLEQKLQNEKEKAEEAEKKAKRELDEYGEMAEEERLALVTKIQELEERQTHGLSAEEYNQIKKEYEKLETRLRESKTTKEIKRVFSGIFEKLEFSKAFASNVDIKPGDSVSRKLCTFLSLFNQGVINPFPNARKQFKGDISRITDKTKLPLYEYDIGSKERLFVQFPEKDKTYITNIDYKHKFSDKR